MTMPFALDEAQVPWDYEEHTGLVDVETGGVGIITDLRAMLVTTLGWTEPSANLFKTPVDAAGRFLDVLLTRISATSMEWRVRNAAAGTICTRRFQIDATGTTIRYYANIFGVVVESMRATPEYAQGHVLDQTPDLQSDGSLYVIGNGHRTTADVADGNGDAVGEYFAIDNGAAGQQPRCRRFTTAAGTGTNGITATGVGTVGDPMIAINHAGTMHWAGRICQCLLLPGSSVGPGTVRRPKIDTDSTAVFQALFLSVTSQMRIAFRRTEI